MKLTKFFMTAILMLGFANSALAFSKKAKKAAPQPEEEIQVYSLPIQQSEIKLVPVAPIPITHHEFEITGSTWAPKNFQLASNINDAGNFERAGLPYLSVNYITKSYDVGSNGTLSTKFGLSYMSLTRSGDLGGTYSHNVSETLNLISLRLGAEYAMKNILPWSLEPAFGLYVLPTWLAASETELDGGVNAYGFPIEASADLLYRSSDMSKLIGSSDLVLGFGLHDIYGNVQRTDMSGLGVQGIIRLSM